MFDKKYFEMFKDEFYKDVNRYIKDYKNYYFRLGNTSCIYKGDVVPFSYTPTFFTENEYKDFEFITGTLFSIFDKVIKEYKRNKVFRKKFNYSKKIEELVLINPGYKVNVPISRIDVFYKNIKNFKLCEVNTDGTSGMNETYQIQKCGLDSEIIKKLKLKLENIEMLDSWVDESIQNFNEWNINLNKFINKPVIAITDFIGGTLNELLEFKRAYERNGYECYLVNADEFRYVNGKLIYENIEINMVYRRLVTGDLERNYEKLGALVQAYKVQSACFIGGFVSQIPHNKIIFKILHDEDTLKLLSENEVNFIKNHIPITREFSDNDVLELLSNKDKYVLKPKDFYATKGVYLGVLYSQEEWKNILEKLMSEKAYLIQDYIEPYQKEMITYNSKDELIHKNYYYMIGLFTYNQRFKTTFVRINDKKIISGDYGGLESGSYFVNK